jgi:hypothetical protein
MKAATSLQGKDDDELKLVNAKLCTEGGNGGCKEWFCVLVTSFFSSLNISYTFQASH